MAGGRSVGTEPLAPSVFLSDFTYKTQYMKDKKIKNVGTSQSFELQVRRPSEHGALYIQLHPTEGGLGLGVVNPAPIGHHGEDVL